MLAPKDLIYEVMRIGKHCAVSITGDPDDAKSILTVEQALAATWAALSMGQAANDELNNLRRIKTNLAEKPNTAP